MEIAPTNTTAQKKSSSRHSFTIDTAGIVEASGAGDDTDGHHFILVMSPKHQNVDASHEGDDLSVNTDLLIAEGERQIKLVKMDMSRTFGNHPLFQDGALGAQKTFQVLEAYTCYRPDLGYVQGKTTTSRIGR
jgi:hypothetical protein